MEKPLTIYTDGGCTGNPGPGGWAAVILVDPGSPVRLSGGESATTNNRMELTAVIRALEKAVELRGEGASIEVHTDSQYVQKGITQWIAGWERKGWRTASGSPVKNKDLWLALRAADGRLSVDWRWVKGHAGHQWNEECDALVAVERAKYS